MSSIDWTLVFPSSEPLPLRLKDSILLFARTLGKVFSTGNREAAFLNLMRNYDEMISRICLGYCKSSQEYEDLRQDVYVNIWRSIERFEGRSNLKTWIYRVALNTCVTNLRRRSREPSSNVTIDLADVVDSDDEHRRRLEEMYEMISQLPDVDKAIVMMWLDELSYEEIAQITGLPRNSVATRLRRAKQKLMNNSL